MQDTLLRQWTLLQLIPRAPLKADVGQLLAALRDAGYTLTRRQLQRDLNTLSTAFPLEADDRSIPYGWSWSRDAAAFDLPRMGGPSALAMKLVQQFMPQLLPPAIADPLQPWFARADAVLAEHCGTRLGRWLDLVRVVPREMPLLAPQVDDETARIAYQALLDGRRFTADYHSRSSGETKRQEVSPLGLVARGNLLYLVATLWDYEDVRQLALHRLGAAEPSDVPVCPPAGFDLDRYIAEGEFHYPVGPTIRLEAKFVRGAAEHLFETPLSADQVITDVDDEHVLVRATVRDTEQLRWWLLGFGEMIEIVSPPILRSEMRTSVAQTMTHYEHE